MDSIYTTINKLAYHKFCLALNPVLGCIWPSWSLWLSWLLWFLATDLHVRVYRYVVCNIAAECAGHLNSIALYSKNDWRICLVSSWTEAGVSCISALILKSDCSTIS